MTGSFIDLVRAGGPLEVLGYSAGERAELLRTCADLLPVDVAMGLDASLGGHPVPGDSFVELVANAPLAPPSPPELGHPADWHDAWPPAPLGHDVADLVAGPAGRADGPAVPHAADPEAYDDDFGHGALPGRDLPGRDLPGHDVPGPDVADRDPSDVAPPPDDVVDPVSDPGPGEDGHPGELGDHLHGLDPAHDVHEADAGGDHQAAPWWEDDGAG